MNQMQSDGIKIYVSIEKDMPIKDIVGEEAFTSKRYKLIAQTDKEFIFEVQREVELNIRTFRYK